LCEKQKTQTCFKAKKVIFGVTVIFGVFWCFDQSDLFDKYILYLSNKKLDGRYQGLSKLGDILSYIEAFSFVTIVRWQKNFHLGQSKQPNFDYPQINISYKIS